jgi:hypothetical protein
MPQSDNVLAAREHAVLTGVLVRDVKRTEKKGEEPGNWPVVLSY